MSTDSDVGVPEPPPVLVRAFIDASLEALQFLAGQPGFRTTVTVEEAAGISEIVPASPETVGGIFWVRRTFSTKKLTGYVTYGERRLARQGSRTHYRGRRRLHAYERRWQRSAPSFASLLRKSRPQGGK